MSRLQQPDRHQQLDRLVGSTAEAPLAVLKDAIQPLEGPPVVDEQAVRELAVIEDVLLYEIGGTLQVFLLMQGDGQCDCSFSPLNARGLYAENLGRP